MPAMRRDHSSGPVLWTLVPLAVDRDGDGHVLHLELVDRLHAEIGEGEDARAFDGLRDEVGRAADGDQIDRLELADGRDGCRAAFGFADHADAGRSLRASGG